jgi:hypothetical protein
VNTFNEIRKIKLIKAVFAGGILALIPLIFSENNSLLIPGTWKNPEISILAVILERYDENPESTDSKHDIQWPLTFTGITKTGSSPKNAGYLTGTGAFRWRFPFRISIIIHFSVFIV